jgi:adenylate cyclase
MSERTYFSMGKERAQRHLAAILAADVVGYSRLMEQDEAETFERLRAHRVEPFEPEIAKHHGRIFKLMGDGLLAEFGSVVDAVECAVTLQRAMAERNTGLAEGRRIDLRIGINLGDVIIEGDDRHGDGGNIAARLQQLAEPGGIAVSRTVVDHVKHKLTLKFDPLGEQRVKNISEPIGVFRLAPDGAARRWRVPARLRARRVGLILGAGVVLLVAAVGATFWYLNSRSQQPVHGLSIVVLPFTNLSSDPEQEYFADALADDLTTDLSRIEGSLVIAPNTARAYRGRNLDARQIGRELNVLHSGWQSAPYGKPGTHQRPLDRCGNRSGNLVRSL